MIYIKQRITVWARNAFGFVRCDQIERPPAIWAAHRGGRYSTCFSLRRLRIAKPDLFQCDRITDKDPRRLHAVIDRRKRVIFAGQIGVAELFNTAQTVGARTFRQIEVLLFISLIYLVVNLPLAIAAERMHRRVQANA